MRTHGCWSNREESDCKEFPICLLVFSIHTKHHYFLLLHAWISSGFGKCISVNGGLFNLSQHVGYKPGVHFKVHCLSPYGQVSLPDSVGVNWSKTYFRPVHYWEEFFLAQALQCIVSRTFPFFFHFLPNLVTCQFPPTNQLFSTIQQLLTRIKTILRSQPTRLYYRVAKRLKKCYCLHTWSYQCPR